jgi:hypothetical protein
MGGIPSKKKKQVSVDCMEEIRQARIKARLEIFNQPATEEKESDKNQHGGGNQSTHENRDPIQQLSLTSSNVHVNSQRLSANPRNNVSMNKVKGLDGPSHILDDRMMKVLEFMLDPEFDKGVLTVRTLLTTNERKSSIQFSDAVKGIEHLVVLVQSSKGHVFGAYIDDKFENINGGWRKGSDLNFLFAMGNVSKQPMKLLVNPERKYSYFSDASTGFYTGQGGFDLSAFSARYVCMNPISRTG